MASPRSPQLGYNHNIPHRGRLYHVQTEDSGVEKAHIFTHVFYDGTIIASNKVDYQDKLDETELDPVIVGMMQESHKALIRSLRSGSFDEKIVALLGDHPAANNKAPEAEVEAQPPSPERPERRPVPEPREVEPQGPTLTPGQPGPAGDPTLGHPVFANREAQAQAEAAAAGQGPRSGPRRGRKRRAVGGIGGSGAASSGGQPAGRRDIIVGKYASQHQADLDEEILALLRED